MYLYKCILAYVYYMCIDRRVTSSFLRCFFARRRCLAACAAAIAAAIAASCSACLRCANASSVAATVLLMRPRMYSSSGSTCSSGARFVSVFNAQQCCLVYAEVLHATVHVDALTTLIR
jgi:hypothetical protein